MCFFHLVNHENLGWKVIKDQLRNLPGNFAHELKNLDPDQEGFLIPIPPSWNTAEGLFKMIEIKVKFAIFK